MQLGVVLLLSLVRSFVASERLALVEVAVPAVAIVALAAAGRSPGAPAGRVLGAGGRWPRCFRALRARSSTRAAGSSSAPAPTSRSRVFALIRLAGYYATSYNNGRCSWTTTAYPGGCRCDQHRRRSGRRPASPSSTCTTSSPRRPARPARQHVLERFGNPEFNNPGGLTTPFVDFGTGRRVRLLRRPRAGHRPAVPRVSLQGSPVGALLYPMVVTGLLDLPRYLYWTQGRVVPAVLACWWSPCTSAGRDTRRRAPPCGPARPLPAHRQPVEAVP